MWLHGRDPLPVHRPVHAKSFPVHSDSYRKQDTSTGVEKEEDYRQNISYIILLKHAKREHNMKTCL